MRTWNIVGKYPIYDGTGSITHTDVTLVSTNEGYATFTERIIGDQRSNTDKEVLELAHEAYFKSEYADRAMAESVQSIDELKKWRDEADKRLAEAEADRNTRFEAMEAKIDKAMAALDTKVDETVAELTELVTGAISSLPLTEEKQDEESTQ